MDEDWKVPLRYTRTELDSFIEAIRSGQSGRIVFAEYPTGGESSAHIGPPPGRSLRFNRLRVIDDPQYALDLAAILTAWAESRDDA